MTQMALHVGGMSCRRCVREVTGRLRDVPGVETVAADAGTSTVRLSGVMTAADVLRAFTGTTYQPRILGNSDETAPGKADQ
jgi:copper chaperone CopZ